MGQDSVYWAKLNEAFKASEGPIAEDNKRKATALVALRDCAALKRFQLQLAGSGLGTPNVLTAANVKCAERVATPAVDPNAGRPPSGSGSDTSPGTATPVTPANKNPVPTCETMNIEDLMTQASNQYAAGFSKSALKLVTTALGCKQDVRMYRTAAMYACAAHDAASAKVHFAKVPGQFQSAIIQRCQQEGIALTPGP
jgi:hypothetical protein